MQSKGHGVFSSSCAAAGSLRCCLLLRKETFIVGTGGFSALSWFICVVPCWWQLCGVGHVLFELFGWVEYGHQALEAEV